MLSLSDVEAARERIDDVVRRTPLEYSYAFSEMTEADVHLKLENFQRTGAFKIRGATNRIATLSAAEQEAGVVTASAGNHAQGVALAATRSGVDATIVMPEHAPISKVKATERYGGRTVLHGADYDEAQAKAHEIEAAEGRTYVHAFDDEKVMAGQGTIGLEIVEDCPDVDTVVVPVGGGGLISGIATAVKARKPDARVIGVQAEGAASLPDSLQAGEIRERESVNTIADGIATRKVGERPFAVIRERVDEVVTVTDEEIAVALTYLLERSKTLVEGAGAVSMAALLFEAFDYEAGETIVPALCGGNIDTNQLTTVLVRGLVETGRYLKIRTVLRDRPGALEDLVEIIAERRANIYAIQHDRTSRDVAMNEADVEIDIETRGHDHIEEVLGALRDAGYTVEVLA
ncbi:threonine ammonia-lyase [Halobellus marinus]|uniref:threonine ammonia-lyase n=1 Tax=Halobellus TaxID=1073986 RepID=UPI0028AFC73C|nr:threonine ammonia-lyase [Halobellus sp. DFY28]